MTLPDHIINTVLKQVLRDAVLGQKEVYESANLKSTKDADVSSQINKLKLSKENKKKADDMAKALIDHMKSNMSATARTAFQDKMTKYLVEWGVPIKSVAKKVDHENIAKLIAAAAV